MTWSVHRIYGGLLILAATIILTGSPPATRAPRIPVTTRIKALRSETLRSANAGLFLEAAEAAEQGYRAAFAGGDLDSAIHLLNNLGGANLGLFNYQGALKAFLEAKDLAEKQRDTAMLSIIDFNLASLYLQFADVPAATQVAQQGLQAAGAGDPYGHKPWLLMTLAKLRKYQGRMPEAIRYAQESVGAASSFAESRALASAWDCLGEMFLAAGDPAAAEEPLEQGFRLRLLFRDRDLRVSYLKLCQLRLAQGDSHSAATLFQRALSLPAHDAGFPAWTVYWLQGKILQAQHRPAEALDWFQKSVEAWKSWRDGLVDVDEVRAVADSSLSGQSNSSSSQHIPRIYSSLIDTTLELEAAPGIDSFVATEEYRAIAIRQTLTQLPAWRERLPPEYWKALQALRRAQTQQLGSNDPSIPQSISHLQLGLTELEVKAGLSLGRTVSNKTFEKVIPSKTLRDVQRSLSQEEALLSFYLGDPVSALWTVTDRHFQLYKLPSGKILASTARSFQAAVEQGSPDRDQLGESLYQQLFGGMAPDVERKSSWVIAASDELFDIPMAALVVARKEGKPVYLVEQHATERIPSALMLRDARTPSRNGVFLGIGDGIYNVADPRWTPSPLGWPFGLPLPGAKKPIFELARLAGSAQEIESCARIWQGTRAPVILTGKEASRESLETGLRSSPAVVHVAAHVMSFPEQPERALIDLGLSGQGQPEVLTYSDIANLDVHGSTVVVNGCASVNAGSAFGAGIMGLTRAWLIAGAQTVIGTRWPIPDDTGDLFQSFYSNWKKIRNIAPSKRIVSESLQRAQLEMLQANTWRSDPKYWSAFYVIGKE